MEPINRVLSAVMLPMGAFCMFNRDVEKLYPLVPSGNEGAYRKNINRSSRTYASSQDEKGSSGQKSSLCGQSQSQGAGVVFDGVDGRFGPMTEFAVKYYQAWHCLPISGEMDEATYRSLGLIK